MEKRLDGLSSLQDRNGDYVIFQPWLNAFEETIIKYSWSQNKAGELSNLKNYATITLILINSMVDMCSSLKRRISIRRDFGNARILNILKSLPRSRIQESIMKLRNTKCMPKRITTSTSKARRKEIASSCPIYPNPNSSYCRYPTS